MSLLLPHLLLPTDGQVAEKWRLNFSVIRLTMFPNPKLKDSESVETTRAPLTTLIKVTQQLENNKTHVC